MKQISDIVDRTVKDIHKIYKALEVAAGTLEDHSSHIAVLETQVEKLTEMMNRIHVEQENMKITHM
jgi:uncharacterized protein YoxC